MEIMKVIKGLTSYFLGNEFGTSVCEINHLFVAAEKLLISPVSFYSKCR